MKISMIAAIGQGNRVLGKDNKLIWDIPEDMRRFREKTKDHIVIMGRKTSESMGRALPQRTNIVVTNDVNWKSVDGVIVYHSLTEIIKKVRNNDFSFVNAEGRTFNTEEAFIIGGAQIYSAALPFADRLYLTIVHRHFEGDAFFPEYEKLFTKVIEQRDSEGNGYKYTFVTLEK